MAFAKLKNRIAAKIKNNTLFQRMFGFEVGIDVTNDNQVLYRKNVVIKNIIFVVNLIYTLIFTFAGFIFGDPSNFLLTILLFPLSFFINFTLKKFLKKGPEDSMSQLIAEYFSCFYMFLSAILVYIKLRYNSDTILTAVSEGSMSITNDLPKWIIGECGYILVYIALTICAFYQDKKLLRNIFLWVFLIVTILHFVVTYNVIADVSKSDNPFMFLAEFFRSSQFQDILIRSLLLGLYMLILYIYASMANYMQDERKKELVKRRQVQEDFTNVVTKIFDVTLGGNKMTEDELREISIVSQMSKKLASLLSLPPNKCDEIYNYSKIHVDNHVSFDTKEGLSEDEKFEALREQTELGSALISRYQLSRKCEDIIRASLEGSDDDEFIKAKREIQSNQESQIILICEMYVTLRSVKSYKRANNHQKSIQFLQAKCQVYFDAVVFDRFIRFGSDFEKIYDEM